MRLSTMLAVVFFLAVVIVIFLAVSMSMTVVVAMSVSLFGFFSLSTVQNVASGLATKTPKKSLLAARRKTYL